MINSAVLSHEAGHCQVWALTYNHEGQQHATFTSILFKQEMGFFVFVDTEIQHIKWTTPMLPASVGFVLDDFTQL